MQRSPVSMDTRASLASASQCAWGTAGGRGDYFSAASVSQAGEGGWGSRVSLSIDSSEGSGTSLRIKCRHVLMRRPELTKTIKIQ